MHCYKQHAGGDACHRNALRNCQERRVFIFFLHNVKTFHGFAQVWFIFYKQSQTETCNLNFIVSIFNTQFWINLINNMTLIFMWEKRSERERELTAGVKGTFSQGIYSQTLKHEFCSHFWTVCETVLWHETGTITYISMFFLMYFVIVVDFCTILQLNIAIE